ncbi:hypothetical protein M0R72_13640 [Candidatus Pacearchaeota archaeon]|jgi:hypothetical protein|nr:hypothetical protein [Candidatus Pacearchaeota archaeon]
MGDIMVRPSEMGMEVTEVKAQVDKIQALMKSVMQPGTHYGKIPGTDKVSLLKAGAEKLGFTFRLLPKFTVTRNDLPGGHREYEVTCDLWHQGGAFAGQGVGNCSTMESKYRYRNIADFEDTGDPIPADSKEKKQEYRKQGYGMKKIDGAWCWVKYKDSSRQENPDIADTYNTVLKMAKKRAVVDATITACAASDIFTQDIADPEEEEPMGHSEPEGSKADPFAPYIARIQAAFDTGLIEEKRGTIHTKGWEVPRFSSECADLEKLVTDRMKTAKERDGLSADADKGFKDDDPAESAR